MGVYTVNQTDGSLQRVAGGTLYADAPIGAIQSYGGVIAPAGWLICDGSAVSRTEYAELFAVIGINFGEGDGETTFGIPDLRECVPVGVGKNITKSIGAHDRYELGQFKDDQVQANYKVSFLPASFSWGASGGGSSAYGGTNANLRIGDNTHGKRLGVNYIIKAKMVGVPADLEAQIDADYQKKDLAQAVEGETTVEDALDALSTNKQPKTLATPIIVGGESKTTVESALGGLNDISVPRLYYNADTAHTTEQNRIDAIEYVLNNLIDVTTFVRPRKIEAIVRYNGGVYFQYTFTADWESTTSNGCDILEIGAYNKIIGTWMGRRTNATGIWAVEKRGVFLEQSDLTSSVTSGSTAPVTSGGVYEELYKAGGIVIANNLEQGANTFSVSNISDALGGNFVGLLVLSDRRNGEIGAIYFVVMVGSNVGLLRQIVSNRATLSESNGTFTYNDSAGLSSSNNGKVTAYKLAYY